MSALRPLATPDTAPLFPPIHAELITLLRSLEPTDWDLSTVAGAWRVRDVVAHLLDGELRTLAAHRDGHSLTPDGTVTGYADVLSLIEGLNASGVNFGERLSPRLLTDLLETTGHWMSTFVTALDPDAPALFPVAWAGDIQSDNRFDTAREYTERWHHQMQIRMAVGERAHPGVLLAHRFFDPLHDTALHVLPHAYRATEAPEGTALLLIVTDASPEELPHAEPLVRTLLRENRRWRLYAGEAVRPTARVTGTPDAFWRLFFNAPPADSAGGSITANGPAELVGPLWRARSVMV